MNAKKALEETKEALTRKERQAKEKADADLIAQQREEEWVRAEAFPAFMKELHTEIWTTAGDGKTWLRRKAGSRLMADLAMAQLLAEGYEAHIKVTYVPEDRDYGSSGESMHDAYTLLMLHVIWSNATVCPACSEDTRVW